MLHWFNSILELLLSPLSKYGSSIFIHAKEKYIEISKAYSKMMPSMVKFSARLKIRIEKLQNLEPEVFPGRRQIRITLTRG